MKKKILLIYLFLITNAIFAQDLEKWYQAGDYDKVVLEAEKIIKNNTNDIFVKANAYSKITNVYRKKGKFQEAQKYAFELVKITENNPELNHQKALTMAYNDLGAIFSDLSLNDKSIEYFEKSLQITRQTIDTEKTGKLLNNLGEVYLSQNKAIKAQKYFEEALEIASQIKDTSSIISRSTNAADAHIAQDNYIKALQYLENAMDLAQKTNRNSKIPFIAFELSRAYLYKTPTDTEKALAYALMTEKYFKAQNSSQYQMYIHQLLTEIYEKKGQGEKALAEYKKFTNLKDSLTGLSAKNKLQELEVQYQTEKKDTKIKSLAQSNKIKALEINELELKNEKQKKENELLDLQQKQTIQGLKISELEKSNQNILLSKENQDKNIALEQKNWQIQQRNFWIIGISFCGVFVIFVVYLIYRQKRLLYQNKAIELEQRLLRSQMNPHFIFNSLTNIQNYLFENETLQTAKYLGKFAKLMRQVLDNSREEFITLEKEILTLKNYLELQQLRFPKKFQYQINIAEDLSPETKIPPMFAQPFIENSLEHGILHKSEEGFLSIDFKTEKNILILEVKDNGVGLQTSQLLRSEAKKEYQSLATKIVQERLELFSEKFKQKFTMLITELDNGLKVKLNLPIQYE